MGKYMTFLFDAEKIKQLLSSSPEYVLINVGYKLIPDPDDPAKQVAQLTVNAEAWQKDKGATDMVVGCPVPPCQP